MVRVLNLILRCGKIPQHPNKARTIFLPNRAGKEAEFVNELGRGITSIYANKRLCTQLRMQRGASMDWQAYVVIVGARLNSVQQGRSQCSFHSGWNDQIRGKDRKCRAGSMRTETFNHIVQKCHQTHYFRIRRHDSIEHYTSRNLVNMGFSTKIEPVLKTDYGNRKLDIIGKKEQQRTR